MIVSAFFSLTAFVGITFLLAVSVGSGLFTGWNLALVTKTRFEARNREREAEWDVENLVDTGEDGDVDRVTQDDGYLSGIQ